MNHTKAPWTVERDATGKAMNIRCEPDDVDSGTFICSMESSRSIQETKKNANLIAASPDLLNGCMAAIAYLADPASHYPANRAAAVEIIEAAIRKAVTCAAS